jgi:HlyD family secretion protein
LRKFAPIIFVLSLLGCDGKKENQFDGYVEGEFVYIAPATSGVLEKMYVTKGEEICAGQKLFALESVNLQAALGLATAKYNNLIKGKRPAEVDVIQKQKEQAEANLDSAQKAYDRCSVLIKTNAVSQSDLDEKRALCRSLQARVQELSATLTVAKMGGRSDEIDAAHQEVIQARCHLDNATPKARQSGVIEDIYHHTGEFVAVGTPVISFLPHENVKIRFFVSEKKLASLERNQRVKIRLNDGEIAAKISFISPKSEFTPPVIYSVESRKKLVFMVEALPDSFDERLHPGMPVVISLDTR